MSMISKTDVTSKICMEEMRQFLTFLVLLRFNEIPSPLIAYNLAWNISLSPSANCGIEYAWRFCGMLFVERMKCFDGVPCWYILVIQKELYYHTLLLALINSVSGFSLIKLMFVVYIVQWRFCGVYSKVTRPLQPSWDTTFTRTRCASVIHPLTQAANSQLMIRIILQSMFINLTPTLTSVMTNTTDKQLPAQRLPVQPSLLPNASTLPYLHPIRLTCILTPTSTLLLMTK